MSFLTTLASQAQEYSAASATAVMVNGNTIFTVANGPIIIVDLMSVCQTANDITASTLQYSTTPSGAGMSAATISGATTTLASVALGTLVRLTPTALTTAPTICLPAAGGVSLGLNVANQIVVQAGTITVVIGVGSTTGTWKHYLRYIPLDARVVVS